MNVFAKVSTFLKLLFKKIYQAHKNIYNHEGHTSLNVSIHPLL